MGLKAHKEGKELKEQRDRQVIQGLKERLVIQVPKVLKEPKARQQEPKGYKVLKGRSVTKVLKGHQQVLKGLKEVQEVQGLKGHKVLQQGPKVMWDRQVIQEHKVPKEVQGQQVIQDLREPKVGKEPKEPQQVLKVMRGQQEPKGHKVVEVR